MREEEERIMLQKKWEENRNMRVVKSADSFQTVEQDVGKSHSSRDMLVNGNAKEGSQRRKSSKDEGKRVFGVGRKSEGLAEFDRERRKAAEELKQRIEAQVARL